MCIRDSCCAGDEAVERLGESIDKNSSLKRRSVDRVLQPSSKLTRDKTVCLDFYGFDCVCLLCVLFLLVYYIFIVVCSIVCFSWKLSRNFSREIVQEQHPGQKSRTISRGKNPADFIGKHIPDKQKPGKISRANFLDNSPAKLPGQNPRKIPGNVPVSS